MRKLKPSDFLAWIAPTVVIGLTVYSIGREKGWSSAIIPAGLMIGFTTWVWLARIRKYSDDPW